MNKQQKFSRYQQGKLIHEKRGKISLFGQCIIGPILRILIPQFIRKKILLWWRKSTLSSRNISHIKQKYQRAISGTYNNLQEFSSRKQQHLVIPTNPHTIIAPVSGFASVIDIKNILQELYIYSDKLTAKELLEHPRFIELFIPGVMITHRIPHYESHRVHMPLSGTITAQITTPFNGGSKTFLFIETAINISLLLCIITRDFTQEVTFTYNRNKNYHLAGEEVAIVNGPPVTVLLFGQNEALNIEKEIIEHSLDRYETELTCGNAIAQATKKITRYFAKKANADRSKTSIRTDS